LREAYKGEQRKQETDRRKGCAYIQVHSHGCKDRGGESRKRVHLIMAVALTGGKSIENGKHVCGERQNALAQFSRLVGGGKQETKTELDAACCSFSRYYKMINGLYIVLHQIYDVLEEILEEERKTDYWFAADCNTNFNKIDERIREKI
jgi:hypothetical protein